VKKKYKHRPFESKTDQGKYTKICNDMMTSPAWEALNLRQQGLYLRLKSKYTQKISNGVMCWDNSEDISLPKSEWEAIYGDGRTFRADRDKLIECGFIHLVHSGKYSKEANIYGFSDEWKNVLAVSTPKSGAKTAG